MAGPTVAVIGPDGTPLEVPAAEARGVTAAGGHAMSPQEEAGVRRRIELEEKYGGVEGAVAPALAGAARGLTLGASDVALSEVGGDAVRHRLLDYQEYDPAGSTIGEVAGVVVPAIFGDEAGVSRLPGLVSKFGAGAEAATARALGGSAFARGAGALARGSIEGGIYEAGKAAGDAALRDEPITAEKVVAAFGHGAVIGGPANLVLHGAGSYVSHLAEGAEGFVGGLRPPRGAQLAEREAGAFSGFGEKVQKTADVKTIKALGGSAADIRALEKSVPGGYRRVAQDLQGDIEATTGKSIGFHNKESLHEYASARVDELGEKLGGMLKKLDEAGSGIAPDAKAFASKVREEIIQPHLVAQPDGTFAVAPGSKEIVHAAENWLSEVEGAFGKKAPTFSEWQKARVSLQNKINYAARQATPEQGALKQIRSIMEKELETSGELAAKQMGSTFADEYQATKSLYQSVRQARELTERGVSRELVNNSFSLGPTMGSIAGTVTSGPVAGLAMGLAGKLVKDRGDQLAADLLSRAARMMGVQRLASRTNEKMAEGVAGLLGTKVAATGSALAAPKSKGKGFFTALLERAPAADVAVAVSDASSKRRAFTQRAQAIAALQTNPAALTAHVGHALGPITDISPGVHAAATNVALKGIAHLASKLPPPRSDANTLQPHLPQKSGASSSEIAQHDRVLEALDDPTVILRKAKSGTLTRDHVEAVKEVYGDTYEEMRALVYRDVVNTKTPLPYARRLQIGVLLDLPTDRSLAPDFVRDMQATYSASDSAGSEPPHPQPSHVDVDVAGSLMTATQSAASEGQDR